MIDSLIECASRVHTYLDDPWVVSCLPKSPTLLWGSKIRDAGAFNQQCDLWAGIRNVFTWKNLFTVTLETENASILLLIFHLNISILLCWGTSNPNHKQSQSSPKKTYLILSQSCSSGTETQDNFQGRCGRGCRCLSVEGGSHNSEL